MLKLILNVFFVFFLCSTTLFAKDGDIDLSFGDITTNLKSRENIARRIAVQTDGKLLTVGYSRNEGNQNMLLMRYQKYGVLDSSFGNLGQVILDTGSNNESLYDIALQSDGKIIVAGKIGSNFVVVRCESNGSLDNSFGVSGLVTISLGSENSAIAVAIDSTGRIIVSGKIGSYPNYNVGIVRLLNNGILDPAFDSDGKVASNLNGKFGSVNDIAIQGDNKIVIAGETFNGDFMVARFDTDGSLDSSFGTNGVKTQSIDGYDSAQSIAIQSTGKIVVVGKSYNESFNQFDLAMVRYNTDGSEDMTFGQSNLNNVVAESMASDDNPTYSAALLTGDAIVVSGNRLTGNNRDVLVSFYNSGGLPALAGTVVTDLGTIYDNAYGISVNTSGLTDRIYVAGKCGTGKGMDAIVVCYTSDGSLNTGFNSGNVRTDINSQDIAYDVAVQDDNKIVVAGQSDNDLAIVRYKADGDLDTDFNSSGIVFLDINGSDCAKAVAIQNDGKIVVAGNDNEDAVLIRLNTDGSLDTSFNSTGIVVTDFSSDGSTDDHVMDVVIQKDGKIVILGGDGEWFILRRYNSDGSQDSTFTSIGSVKLYSGSDSFRGSLAIHPDQSFVIGGSRSFAVYDADMYAAKFPITTGPFSIDFTSTFHTTELDYLANPEITNYDDFVHSIAIQKDGKIVLVGQSDNELIIARLDIDGTLDQTFHLDGARRIAVESSFSSSANSVLIDCNGQIIVGGTGTLGHNFCFFRFNENGSLDFNFGTQGFVSRDFGERELLNSMALQKDGKIIAVGTKKTDEIIHDFALTRLESSGCPQSIVPVLNLLLD